MACCTAYGYPLGSTALWSLSGRRHRWCECVYMSVQRELACLSPDVEWSKCGSGLSESECARDAWASGSV